MSAILALDVGEKRIGVAVADTAIKIAVPFDTVQVDGSEVQEIKKLIQKNEAHIIVIGYPRNQSGETTAQTEFIEEFAKHLDIEGVKTIFQDESLTSVQAENQLKELGHPYEKGDIDKRAAAIILQDYLETH